MKVKTVVADPMGITTEIETTHREKAAAALGGPVRLLRSQSMSHPRIAEDSLDVTGHEYHILSEWELAPTEPENGPIGEASNTMQLPGA